MLALGRAWVLVGAAALVAACSSGDAPSAQSAGSSDAAATATTDDAATIGAPDAGPGDDASSEEDAGPDPTFSSKVYVLPQKEYAVPRVADAIDAALAAHPATDTLVFFVHGRSCGGGGEPQKSLGSVVPEIESNYGAAAIMFFWPGSDSGCPLGFPEKEARDAGPALRFMVGRVDRYRKAHASALANVKLVLLTHSMGNIVLESALGTNGAALAADLFGTLVLNSSATALAGHAAWLGKVDFASNVYVTVNSGDNVLLAATAGRGTRLGRQLDTEPLTPRATYVDFSADGVNHQYYVASGQKGPYMGLFYKSVMKGLAYDFATSTAIDHQTTRSGATIYAFK